MTEDWLTWNQKDKSWSKKPKIPTGPKHKG